MRSVILKARLRPPATAQREAGTAVGAAREAAVVAGESVNVPPQPQEQAVRAKQ